MAEGRIDGDRLPAPEATDPARTRWLQVSGIFDAALDLPRDRRDALLDQRCGGDADLRMEVEALLQSADSSAGFLDGVARDLVTPWPAGPGIPPGGSPLDAADDAPDTDRLGPFRVVREIGHGGMGAVYLAERTDPELRQRVAIKLVREGLRSGLVLRRFLDERQILANLDHPDIARLVDGGVTPTSVPWFAMEYVEGVPLDRFCDERGLSVEERIALFCRVCDAVHFAHRKLVVHCDLKPSNILVTADGQPKLLDFGIARLLGTDTAPESSTTLGGARLLTPDFASPEQLRGEPVSTASDVYALGLLLYRLLCGSHPFRPREAPQRADGRLVPPSAAVTRRGEHGEPQAGAMPRGLSAARLHRRLRGDLDAIVLKALRHEPEQRYSSAEQLAADLRRHLAGHPVTACEDTRAYRARKFVLRNRGSVAFAAVAALLLLGFSVVAALQAERIAAERDRAELVEDFLVGLLQRADPYTGTGRAMTVRELLDNGAAQLGDEALEPPEVRSRLFFALGKAYRGLGEYDRAIELLDSTHVLLRRMNGETHPATLGAANQLADVLRVAGRYDDARNLYIVILAARRERFGERSAEVARSLNGLGMVLRMQGHYDEAEALLREALAIDRGLREAQPTGLPQSLNNLGHVMRERGDFAAAEALHRESLAARRALWGDEHFEVSVSLSNLAGVLRDLGDYPASDSVYRQALELRQRLVGDQHHDLATDRAGYALLLYLRGEHDAAESLFRQALAVHRRALPEGHLVTATTLLGLGLTLTARGDAEAAEPLLAEALAARERVLPPGHWMIAEARSARGAVLSRLGREAEAEALLRESYETLAARRLPGDPLTLRALGTLVEHLESFGRRAEAARYDLARASFQLSAAR